MAEERPTRTKKRSAWSEKLRKARQGGQLSDSDESADEGKAGKVYDEVDEGTYSHLRRKLQDEFVVDDDGAGYGEGDADDLDDDYDNEDDEDMPGAKPKEKKRKAIVPMDHKPKKRINNLFLGVASRAPSTMIASGTSSSATAGASAQKVDESDDKFLESLMTDFFEKPKNAPAKPTAATTTAALRLSTVALLSSSTTEQAPSAVAPSAAIKAAALMEDKMDLDALFAPLPTKSVPAEKPTPAPVAPKSTFVQPQMPTKLVLQPKFEEVNTTAVTPVDNGKSAPQIEDGKLSMFWTDLCEVSGVLYLFGKVAKDDGSGYMSCCVAVKNMQRNVFVLPREKVTKGDGTVTDDDVTMPMVYEEIAKKMDENNIQQWASKVVTRKYGFELPNIPGEANYLKVVYPFSSPALALGLKGTTFSHVFGTNTNMVELFLRKRHLMGPCWITVSNAAVSNLKVSYCKHEVTVTNPKDIVRATTDRPAPPLVVMSLSFKTLVSALQQNGHSATEIAIVSSIVHNQVNIDGHTVNPDKQYQSFMVVRQQDSMPFPPSFAEVLYQNQLEKAIIKQPTERALLGRLMAHILSVDPDILVGHNFVEFGLDVLLNRLRATKADNWSAVGRLKRSTWPKQLNSAGFGDLSYAEKQIVSGRLVCDTYISARDLLSKQQNYSLSMLASTQLNTEHESIDFHDTPKYYFDANKLLELIYHCKEEARLTLGLMFKLQILPLTKQLTNLAGNLWSHTMAGARAERNEYLLLHEFHKRKFICPDKAPYAKKPMPPPSNADDDDDEADDGKTKGTAANKTGAAGAGKRKPQYAGGLVLDPKRGFYEKFVIMLDFNSLYPSIIQEYNICFTTVNRTSIDETKDNADVDVPMPDIPDKGLEMGVLPRLLQTLVQRRRQVKNLMKDKTIDANEYSQLNIRQQALKLTANSMYGCLGFSHSRFYAKPLAMLITSIGRDTLQKTVTLAEQKCGLEVIYGDTDSIFINTNSDDLQQAKALGGKLKKEVNQLYKLLEIELDGVFQKLLLLKKKKYVALLVDESTEGVLKTTREIKGVDMVRRDWCDLAKDLSSATLDVILSDNKTQEEVVEGIHDLLRSVAKDVRDGSVQLQKFAIHKSLTKAPEDYADAKSQPHVQVALRLKSKGYATHQHDTIQYIICQGDTPAPASRAYHPDEILNSQGTLLVDVEWYIRQQLHAPITRLCEPIQGTDAGQIASCLGLDPGKYAHSGPGSVDVELKTLDSQLTDEERYADAIAFKPVCHSCGQANSMEPVLRKSTGTDIVHCFECPEPNCGKLLNPYSIASQLNNAIRNDIQRYYDGWVVCDDPACRNRTRQIGVYGRRCLVPGCRGVMHPEFSDSNLYTQLTYYSYLFDVDHHLKKMVTNINDVTQIDRARKLLSQLMPAFEIQRAVSNKYLKMSARRFVDLSSLFSFTKTA